MKLDYVAVLMSAVSLPVLSSPTPHLVELMSRSLDKRHCGYYTWDATNVSNWAAADTDNWLSQWWGKNLGGNGESTSAVIPNGWPNDFVNLFAREYLNGAQTYHCAKEDDQCFTGLECEDIVCSQNWGPECDCGGTCDQMDVKRPIYMVMQSLQSFQDYFKDFIGALDQTQMNYLGMSAYLTKSFFPKPDASSALFLKEFFNALATVFSIAGSYAKLIPIIAGNNVAKETSGALGALLGGIGNGYRETVKYPSDPSFENMANLNRFMTDVAFEGLRSTLNNMQVNIAQGKYWQGKNFRDIAAGGAFLPGRGSNQFDPNPTIAPQVLLRQYLQKQFNARAINYIWRKEKIFITYTSDVDGTCADDKQGPQDMKYCRPGDPGVYYMYWWHQKSANEGLTLGLDNFNTGKMDYPTGWDKLNAIWIDEGYNLKLEDVFEASISAWQAAGPNYDGQTAIDRARSAVGDAWAHPWDKDTAWEGTFTIPICNTGDLSYNVQMGERIMPCGCDQLDGWRKNANFEGYQTYDEQCTESKVGERRTFRKGGKGNIPSTAPALPTDVNNVQCLGGDGPTKSMMSQNTYCSQAIASLGTDMSKQICTDNCADGGHTDASNWCRIALDNSNIHFCALTLAAKDKEHGGSGTACITVQQANDFFNTAHNEKGCHIVGSPDFAATFVPPSTSSETPARWCLSDYENAGFCTI